MATSTAHGSDHVDRTNELAIFDDMLSGTGTPHILLIQAEGGMGKTSLLGEFWEKSAHYAKAMVDLKGGTHSVQRVLAELTTLDHARFETFRERERELASVASNISVHHNRMSGSQMQLTAVDVEQQEARRLLLTDAFFEDLVRSGGQPTVLIFDTYQQGAPEVRDWLSGLFLGRVRSHRWLVAVVAGQSIPELGIGWNEWCLKQELRPLEREHVREYISRQEYISRIELKLSDKEIAVIYETSGGIPLELKTMVKRLILTRQLSRD